MFYPLSKTVWPLVDPLTVLGALFAATAVFLWWGRPRVARWTATIAVAFMLFVMTVPIGGYVNLALERRFPANPPLPETVDGIIVLGGSMDALSTLAYDQPSVGGSFERVIVFTDLAKRFPSARLIYTGGRHLETSGPGEAGVARPILQRLGIDPTRVLIESESRNTDQNAALSLALVRPSGDETWILVTSASHMPRAMGTFRKAGWPRNLIAYPTDFQFLPDAEVQWFDLRLGAGLGQLRKAMHEVTGLASYHLTGRSETWFPGPLPDAAENPG